MKLTVDKAQDLVAGSDGDLCLDDVVSLTVEAAEALAAHKSLLSLQGLSELSEDLAIALAKCPGDLCLNGRTELTPAVAAALSQHQGELVLEDFDGFADEVVNELVKHVGPISVPQLRSLTNVALASRLARQFNERELWLDSVTHLSSAAAEALALHSAEHLTLGMLENLDAETAGKIAEHYGPLCLGLPSLAPDVAEALAQHEYTLALSVPNISGEAAEKLAMHVGDTLDLPDLTELTDEVAAAFAHHKGCLVLNGVESLSDEAAEALAKHEGELALEGLTRISEEALEALRANEDVRLPDE